MLLRSFYGPLCFSRLGMLALTLSTAFWVSRPVAAASVKARSERDICGAVPVPFGRDLRRLRSAELPYTQPCKTRLRIPLILLLV